MKLPKKEKRIINIKYNADKNISPDELKKIKIKENEIKTYINNILDEFISIYEKAKNYRDFENNFYIFWYSLLKKRFELIPVVEPFSAHYEIKLPNFFYNDKKLFEAEVKFNKKQNVKQNGKSEENSEKYVQNIIDIGGSRIEIYGNKPIDLKKKLESELNQKKEAKELDKIFKLAEGVLTRSKNYREYLIKLKPIYVKLYKKYKDLRGFELYRGYIAYGLPRRKKEWLNDIPNVTMLTLQTVNPIPLEELNAYLKEEELLKKYKDEKYIIRPMVYNDNYPINEREQIIYKCLNFFKKDKDIYEFLSNSVEKQVNGFLKHDKEIKKSLEIYKEERRTIYSDLIAEIENSKFYSNLSQINKDELEKIYKKLVDINISSMFYYDEYQDIKAEIDRKEYVDLEKESAFKVGFDNLTTWKYAFFVLVFRNMNNEHFKNCFDNEINVNDLLSIENCFERFNGSYKTTRSRRNK